MATLVFLLKRFIAQRLLGVAIVVTLGFTIGVLVAGPIYADAAREAILSSEIRTAAITVKNIRLTVYGGPTFAFERTDAEVRAASERVPLERIVRQGLGTIRLSVPGGEPLSLGVFFRDGASAHLRFRGQAPVGPGQIALPGGVARLLGARLGDELVAIGPTGEETGVTLSGTFSQPDDDEAYWYADQSPFPPPDSTELPPALMDPDGYLATIPGLGVTTAFVWDAYVDYTDLTFEEAGRLPGILSATDRSLRDDPALARAQATTGIPTMIELVRQRVADLRVPIFLVVFQIGAVTLAILAGVGSLVLTRQSFELAVLRSRGFSAGKLLGGQAVQAALSALVAFPLGLALGMALALFASNSNGPTLPGVLFPIRLNGLAQALGIAGAALGAGALLLLSVPHLRRTILEERRLLSREERPLLARVPVELFVAPVAAFAFVQLRGSDVRSTLQRGSLDPLVLLTPTLIIFTLSFLSLRLLLFVLRRLDRRVGRSRRLPAYLAARRLGRSPGTSFATSLLLVLAFGLLVVSTSYRAIVLRNHEDSAHQQVGADWNVEIAVPEQPLLALDDVPPNATPVIRTEPKLQRLGTFSAGTIALGVDPRSYATSAWWRSDYSTVPLEGWLAALETPEVGAPVAGESFAAELTADRDSAGLELVVTYLTASGEVRDAVGAPFVEGTAPYAMSLPGADLLLSITVRQEEVGSLPGDLEIGLRSVTVGTAPLPLADWEVLAWRGSGGSLAPTPDGVDVTIAPGVGHIVGGIAPPMAPLPALVSPEVASSQGPAFEATVGGQLLRFRRVAVAEHFPSIVGDFLVTSTPGLLNAAARIPEAGLALNEVWAMGEDPRPALERAGFIPGRVDAAGPIVGILAQLPQSLAVGMNYATAAGGLGLVVIGVAVGLYFAQRRREFEFASLRAMGAGPRQVARVLLLEQGLMIAFAIVVGAGLGYGVLRLVMPYVGRSIGTGFPEPVLRIDWVSMGVALAAIVAATAIGLLAALRALLRASVTSVLRGEAE